MSTVKKLTEGLTSSDKRLAKKNEERDQEKFSILSTHQFTYHHLILQEKNFILIS